MAERTGKISLGAIFGRFLAAAGGGVILSSLLWWTALMLLMYMGIVLPAGTAAASLAGTQRQLQAAGGSVPYADMIPHWYRWALFDENGEVMETDMNERMLGEAARFGTEGGMAGGFPYSRYYSAAALGDGKHIVLEYDYSVVYKSALLQKWLPDFQICAVLLLLGLWGVLLFLCTRHYAGILRRDASRLAEAVSAIGQRRLDAPFPSGADVKELGEILSAMAQLREELADSFSRQWIMEQERSEELAALTHDLKTPLTIIQGNADLLAESDLTGEQTAQAEAIAEEADRIGAYVARLREVVRGELSGDCGSAGQITLAGFLEEAARAGRALCDAAGITLKVYPAPDVTFAGQRGMLLRAVRNLLDNAARYTPAGGTVELEAAWEDGLLTVTVRDSGSGFSDEALRKGGSIFYTSDSSRPAEGHMGIGLKLASDTAKAHGGTLKLYNTDHGGAAEICLRAPEAPGDRTCR